MRESQLSDRAGRGPLGGWMTTCGLSVAIVAGCLDVALSLWLKPPDQMSGAELLLVVGVTLLATLAAFGAGLLVLRPFSVEPAPLVAALAILALLAIALASAVRSIGSSSIAGMWREGLLLGIMVLLAAASVFAGMKAVPRLAGRSDLWAKASLAGPLAAVAALASFWLVKYREQSEVLAYLVLLVAAALGLAIFRWVRSPGMAGRVLACGALAILTSPWLPAWERRQPEISPRHLPLRHIVLISIDTLRADEVSAIRPGGARTPHLDAFAREAALFPQAYSAASWTLPAMTSVLSGLAPEVHGAVHMFDRVPDRLTTVAEVLRRAGYRTSALVSSPVLDHDSNLMQGFDEQTLFPGPWMGHSLGATILTRLLGIFPLEEAPPPDQAALASAWLRENRDSDFFYWIHFIDPHEPYGPPRRYLEGKTPPPGAMWRFEHQHRRAIEGGRRWPSQPERAWIRELYRGEVRFVDEFVGSVIAELKRLEIYDEALVIVVSDHGEEFWEHGWFGHGRTLYDELLHVPFLVKLPFARQAQRIDVPVSTASIAPTILEACGLPLPGHYPAAASLLPLLTDSPRAEAPPALFSSTSNISEARAGVRFGKHKYILWEVTGMEELYDLESDPGERVNLAAFAPEELAQGRRLLAHHQEKARRDAARLGFEKPDQATPDAGSLERLRALGYIR